MKRKTSRAQGEPTETNPVAPQIRIEASWRTDLLRQLEGAAEGVRQQPWPEASRSKAAQEPAPYDRRRAAKDLLRLEDLPLDPKSRKLLMMHADALARHLPESLEDLDGVDVFEWLERELPIHWVDDQLALPQAEQCTLTALIESALSKTERGAMPQTVGHDLAQSIIARISLAVASKTAEVPVERIEKHLVEFLVSWLWQAKGIEHAVAERAVESLANALRIRWVAPPRPERAYSPEPDMSFEIGDILVHSKFGRGTVTSRTDTWIEVKFSDGSRKLGSRMPS